MKHFSSFFLKWRFHAGHSSIFFLLSRSKPVHIINVSLTRPRPWPWVVDALIQCLLKKKAEDEIMADVRGSAPPGYVSNRPKDTVSSTGVQICNVGNIMMVWFPVLWLETACRQELDLTSVVGSSGLHLKDVQKREQELKMT